MYRCAENQSGTCNSWHQRYGTTLLKNTDLCCGAEGVARGSGHSIKVAQTSETLFLLSSADTRNLCARNNKQSSQNHFRNLKTRFHSNEVNLARFSEPYRCVASTVRGTAARGENQTGVRSIFRSQFQPSRRGSPRDDTSHV